MKNNFIIDSDEKQRILSLHENSTKNQYLNVLSEQAKADNQLISKVKNAKILQNKVVATKDHRLNSQDPSRGTATVFKSTEFYQTDKPDILKTNGYVKAGDVGSQVIAYDCVTGKFIINGSLYNSETLEQYLLKPFCQKNKQGGSTTISSNYTIQNKHTLNKGAVKIDIGSTASKSGENVVIKNVAGKDITTMDCKTGKFIVNNTQVDADGGNFLRDTLMKKFCKSSPLTNKVTSGKVTDGNQPVVTPKDIDLSQIIKDLPADLQTVLTPPTIDGQPNTSGVPDFNQLLTQLQGLQ